MLSYCDISATPAFQYAVTELTPELGDRANKEVYRDYLEYSGKLREPKEILAKLSKDYFSTVKPAKPNQSINNEIEMTQAAKFKELGRSIPKKQLSNVEIIKLRQLISKVNNDLERKGINRVYRLPDADVKQVGQSDNYTWQVRVYPGKLDVHAKIDRLYNQDLLTNKGFRLITQGTNQLKIDLQNNVRTALLGIDSTTNGDNNNRSTNTKFNTKVLKDSIPREFSNPEKVLFGTLRQSGQNLVFQGESKQYNSDIIRRFSENSFRDIFNSDDFSSEDIRLYIATRFLDSINNNKLNRDIKNGLRSRLSVPKTDPDVRIIDIVGYPFIFSMKGNLYINFAKDSKKQDYISDFFKDLYNQGVDLDKFVDITVLEELIHGIATELVSRESFILAFEEFATNPELIDKISNYYSLGNVKFDPENEDLENIRNLGVLTNEFIRAIVQKNLLGISTEDVKHTGKIADFIKDIWKLLSDLLIKSKFPFHRKIANQIIDFINSTKSPIEDFQTDFVDSISTVNYSQKFIRKYSEILNLQLGVDYNFITSADAQTLTKDSKNPWSGQKSFFYRGKIYFIEGQLTPDDVLHEFIHPVIKSIAVENKSLFDNLYSKLASTEEGTKTIEEVTDLYPDLEEFEFKQEVLVRSLVKMQDLNNRGLESTSEFKKFVDNLLYSIKQFLRKVFGQKIQVSKLDQNTTLRQLSDMLEFGGQFELDPTIITDDEWVQYKNEYNKYLKDFVAEKADVKEIETLTNTYFNTVSKHIKNLRDKNDLGELADILQNNYKSGELQKMKQNLKSYQTLIQQDSKKLEDEVELTRQRVTAGINSLGNVDNMIGKILEGLRDLVKDIDNPDNVQRVLYYQKVLNYWGDFVNTANRTLENNGIRNIKMIDSVNANVRRANDLVNDFYNKASASVLWDILKISAENIDRKWEQRITDLKTRKAPAEVIAKAEADAKAEKITPLQIEQALKGELKDLSFANAYLEGYSYSPDPVVGGLALFVKNKITEVEVKSQAKFNDAITILKPLLDKVGYNPNRPGEIGEKLGQKEKVGKINSETGEFEEREVWRFLNEFTGADIARDQYLFKINQASAKYGETGSEVDRKALANIQSEWEQHRRDYFHDEYSESFYKAYDIIKRDEIGNLARMQMNDLYDKLNLLSGQMAVANTDEILEISDQVEVVRRQIKQLSSLYALNGSMKEGEDLAIALRLKEFNEAIAPLYRSEEIPNAFQNAYLSYDQKLKDEGKKPGTGDYDQQMQKWLDRNTRTVIKEEFWTEMDALNKAIQEITSHIPQQEQAQLDIDEAYQIIKEMVKGNRDESGQPLGNELSPERQEIVKQAQERINKARETLNSMSGLAKHEQDQIQAIYAKFPTGVVLTPKEQLTLSLLLDKQNSLSLGKVSRARLNSLFNELEELRSKEPTDAYIDNVNSLLSVMDADQVIDIFGSLNVDKLTVNRLKVDTTVQRLKELSPEFIEWFDRNHTSREVKNYETNEPDTIWDRTYAWSVIKPIESKYYESTTIKNAGGETIELKALPSLKYYKRLVKDEFITPEIEGETVDNRGYWLPRTMAQGAKDDRYQNKDYDRIKKTDPDLFKLLEAVKKIHLDNQKGLSKKAKLYLDMPRYRKQITERLQSENPVSRVIQRMKDFWIKTKDAFENGFNFSDDLNLIKLDLFDDDINTVPISGLSDLDIKEVSTDAIFTTMRYSLAAERAKGLQEIAPIARMIQKVVNNEENYPLESKVLNNSTLVYSDKKKSKYLRARAVNNFIESHLEGKVNTGFGSESAIAQNVSNFIFKRASSAFLDVNIPSALKNALSAKFQIMIESMAGKHLTFKDFIAAEKDATVATMKITTEIYKQSPKSLDLQIIEIFDPERDRFHNTFGEAVTRTPFKDYSFQIMGRLNDFRRVTQLQTSLQTLFGMMRHEIIPTDKGHIPYKDAWEIIDGKIQLKSGIDPTWGIIYDKEGNQVIGEKFKQKRNEYQRVIDNVNGNMSREDRPEADRYLLFRYISFFRRFLTSMITNRFAKNRADYTYGDHKEGFYVTFTKLLLNTFKSAGKNLPYASPEEKAASIRLLTEVGSVMVLKYLVLGLILGYDDDDKDRFKKLKANSGSLPLPFVFDDPRRPFDIKGWFENHAVLQTLQIISENDQFLPLPGLGLNQIKDWFSIKSLAFGPTTDSAINIINDAYRVASGDDKAYYQKAAGSYDWNQEGDLKLFNHVAKAIGFSSSTIDPARAAQIFESFQNR